jgi:hypothetical protein
MTQPRFLQAGKEKEKKKGTQLVFYRKEKGDAKKQRKNKGVRLGFLDKPVPVG